MRPCEIDYRADGDDSRRINFGVRHVVMPLDVIEVHGVRDSGLLVQVHQIPLQVRVIDNAAQIAFEMAVINGVEPHERAEKSPVRFDDAIIE